VITEGLDVLRDRINDYVGLGAKFAEVARRHRHRPEHALLQLHQRQMPRRWRAMRRCA